MSRKTLLYIFLAIGCIGLIITLSIVLTRKRYDCYLGSNVTPLTGISFEQLDRDVLVTWNRPYEMLSCNQGYEVTYSTIQGTISNITHTESITIPYLYICFEFDITIKPITATSSISYGRATFHDPRELDIRYYIPRLNPSQVIVTWTHPNQEWCPLRFMVTYQTPSDKLVYNVTEPELKFNYVYCTPVTLTIQAINPKDGSLLSTQPATIDATQYPQKVERVRDTDTIIRDNEMEILWTPTKPIGTCRITYQVSFSTDLAKFTLATKIPNIILTRRYFCFNVSAIIQAVLDEKVRDIGNTGVVYGIAPVNDVKLIVYHTNSTIAATWSSHPLRELCGVRYEVTFQRGDRIDTVTRSVPNITYDLIYCVNTTVHVKALRKDGGKSKESNATNPEEFPTSLELVQNVSLTKTGSSVTVSWKVTASVINCGNLYNVTARNDGIPVVSTCQGTTGCEISLPDFCPQTTFTIKPASPLEGEEVIRILTC